MGKKLYLIAFYVYSWWLPICLFLGSLRPRQAAQVRPRCPRGTGLPVLKASPHYRDGKFQNLIQTPKFSKDVGWVSLIWSGIFDKNERLVPDAPLPAVKTDLKALEPGDRHRGLAGALFLVYPG